LPGIASSVKRAATSATRCEPEAITMNWIVQNEVLPLFFADFQAVVAREWHDG
jgi:hypothetical protein